MDNVAEDPTHQASRGVTEPPSSARTTREQHHSEPHSFEWVPHGDPGARRRARAHVTRNFRRQKALEAASHQSGEKFGHKSHISKEESLSEQGFAIFDRQWITSETHPDDETDIKSSAQTVIEELVLQRTLGTGGRADPFQCFPIKLSPNNQALLDHCKSTQGN
jgi:hypothetical protein